MEVSKNTISQHIVLHSCDLLILTVSLVGLANLKNMLSVKCMNQNVKIQNVKNIAKLKKVVFYVQYCFGLFFKSVKTSYYKTG